MPVTIVFADEDNDYLNDRFSVENEEGDLVLKPFVEKEFFLPIDMTVRVKVGRDCSMEDTSVVDLDDDIGAALEAGGHETHWQWAKSQKEDFEESVLFFQGGTIKKKIDVDWDTTHCDVHLNERLFCLTVADGYEVGQPSTEPWRMDSDGYRAILEMSQFVKAADNTFRTFNNTLDTVKLPDALDGVGRRIRRAQQKVSKLQRVVAEGVDDLWRDFFACPLPIGQAMLFLATALPFGFTALQSCVPSQWGKVAIEEVPIEVPMLNDGWEDAIVLRDDHGKSLSWRWAPFQREALMLGFEKCQDAVYCAPILAVRRK